MILIKKIWNAVAFFFIQVFYRFYELNPKDEGQANKLGGGGYVFLLWANFIFIFELPVLFKILEPEYNIRLFVFSGFFSLIIGLTTVWHLMKYVEKHLKELKSQEESYQWKWRIIVYLYTIISFVVIYFLDKKIK